MEQGGIHTKAKLVENVYVKSVMELLGINTKIKHAKK